MALIEVEFAQRPSPNIGHWSPTPETTPPRTPADAGCFTYGCTDYLTTPSAPRKRRKFVYDRALPESNLELPDAVLDEFSDLFSILDRERPSQYLATFLDDLPKPVSDLSFVRTTLRSVASQLVARVCIMSLAVGAEKDMSDFLSSMDPGWGGNRLTVPGRWSLRSVYWVSDGEFFYVCSSSDSDIRARSFVWVSSSAQRVSLLTRQRVSF